MEPNSTPPTVTQPVLSSPQQPSQRAWIIAARDKLIATGINSVKIKWLAQALNTEKENFYRHFKNREQLLRSLLLHWIASSTRAYEQIMDNTELDSIAKLNIINRLWLEENCPDQYYEIAIREWARNSEIATNAIKYSDRKRVKIFETLLLDLSYDRESAAVRARAAYCYQISHLVVAGFHQTAKNRRAHAPIFLDMLLGR